MMKEKLINDFQVNDTYTFRRTFTAKDFAAFSAISGDENPLHHDTEYAENTRFSETIVPLHLAASPLSAIAGMVFPGHRSLYLSHQLKALNPVLYNVEVTYSAKIIAIDIVNRILTIRTIVFQGRQLLIEAEQKIQVRDDAGEALDVEMLPNQGEFIQPSNAILITGAAGELGQCVMYAFARHGHDLVLQVRESNDKILSAAELMRAEYDVHVDIMVCDLAKATVDEFTELLEDLDYVPSSVVHCASPALTADLNALMNVNYRALKHLSDALLPAWLEQQQGTLIFVSSSATHFHPEGWQDYCAAKTAGVNFCSSFNHRFQALGLSAKVISPGLIATEFSSGVGLDQENAMLPEHVADTIVEMLSNEQGFYTWVEQGVSREGGYGFFAKQAYSSSIESVCIAQNSSNGVQSVDASYSSTLDPTFEQQVQTLIKSHLGLTGDVDWQSAGVAVTPKWDSLNHMLLLVEIEREFNVAFASIDMDRTATFQQLLHLIKEKLV